MNGHVTLQIKPDIQIACAEATSVRSALRASMPKATPRSLKAKSVDSRFHQFAFIFEGETSVGENPSCGGLLLAVVAASKQQPNRYIGPTRDEREQRDERDSYRRETQECQPMYSLVCVNNSERRRPCLVLVRWVDTSNNNFVCCSERDER